MMGGMLFADFFENMLKEKPDQQASAHFSSSPLNGTVFRCRTCLRASKTSSRVSTLSSSSKDLAIAYRMNSDFEGNPLLTAVAAMSLSCSGETFRLIVFIHNEYYQRIT